MRKRDNGRAQLHGPTLISKKLRSTCALQAAVDLCTSSSGDDQIRLTLFTGLHGKQKKIRSVAEASPALACSTAAVCI